MDRAGTKTVRSRCPPLIQPARRTDCPVTGEAADLLTLIRTPGPGAYVTLIERLRPEDPGDPTLSGRRWPVQHLRDILRR
jgi:hypothetical protein